MSAIDTMPVPQNERQKALISAVYQRFVATATWPTFAQLDKDLDASGEPDAESVIREMPSGLLYGLNADSWPCRAGQDVALTIAGVCAVSSATSDVELFVNAIRLAAKLEQDWFPDTAAGDGPRLDEATVREHIQLPPNDSFALLRLAKLLATEHWGWSSWGSGEAPNEWQFTVSRNARRLRGLVDVKDYWARAHVQQPIVPDPPVADLLLGVAERETPSFEAVLDYLSPDIRAVAECRLRDGYGDNAVEEACKAVAQRIRDITGLNSDLQQLANEAFGKNGAMSLGDRTTDAGRDDHEGHAELVRGLFRVGRNSRAHRPSPAQHDDLEVIRLLVLASICSDRLDRYEREGASSRPVTS